jgi:hypothetical protein
VIVAVKLRRLFTAIEQRNTLPSAKLRRGMPEQMPLLLIGRLAVDAEWRGLGSAPLADALKCLDYYLIVGVNVRRLFTLEFVTELGCASGLGPDADRRANALIII